MSISKIYLDILIKEAKEAGYIMQYDDGDMMLTDKGKMFAIENNIVQ